MAEFYNFANSQAHRITAVAQNSLLENFRYNWWGILLLKILPNLKGAPLKDSLEETLIDIYF